MNTDAPSARRLSRASLLAVVLTLATLLLSLMRYHMEAYPAKIWKGEDAASAAASREQCPDGMDDQIRLFAAALAGEEHAAEKLAFYVRELSHQSSTWLVGALGAPLVLLGLSPAVAFVVISTLASLVLVCLVWWVAGEMFGGKRSWQLGALALFLWHPGTLRCFVRPQTDALLAAFALAALVGGWRAARASGGWFWGRLAATQLAASFVKIHAISLVAVPPVVAWLAGARGRSLRRVLLFGSVLPLLGWLAVFTGFDLFDSIRRAWMYKNTFYQYWDASLVLEVLGSSSGLLLLLAFLHPWPWRGLPAACACLVLGLGAILLVCSIPPLPRFQYPAVAPLCLLAVSTLYRRTGGSRRGLGWLLLPLGVTLAVSAAVVYALLYQRYFGPVRDLGAFGRFVYHLI